MSAQSRGSAAAAARDLALVQVLGGAGLRSGEARSLPVDPLDQDRSDNHGGSVYLRVHGKGHKIRSVPLYTDITAALEQRRDVREQIPELAGDRLFPRLGRGRRDGSFPDAGGQLSTTAVIKIVRPIMLAAGIPETPGAPPHAAAHLRAAVHGSPGRRALPPAEDHGARSPEMTSRYLHHADVELATEHRRIERLQHDPLARRQQQRRDRSDHRPTSRRPPTKQSELSRYRRTTGAELSIGRSQVVIPCRGGDPRVENRIDGHGSRRRPRYPGKDAQISARQRHAESYETTGYQISAISRATRL